MLQKKTLWYLLICLLLFPSIASAKKHDPAPANATSLPPHVPNQIVVKLKNDVALPKINNKFGTELLETLLDSQHIYLLHTDDDAASVAAAMVTDGRVTYAELNYIIETPVANPMGEWAWGSDDLTIANEANPMGEWAWGGNSTDGLTQYATDMIGLPTAHQTSLGEGVIVAVIDTGVQANHPYLAGHIASWGYDFVDDDSDPSDSFDHIDNDGDGLIDEATGHGTHIAGIIHTTAPAATILPVRVLDSDGRGNLYLIVEAIEYAVFNGARVINLSLGSTFDSALLADALAFAEQRKVVVVAAAGNLNSDVPQYPAAYDNVIGVAAVTPDSTRMDGSNYGAWVDLAAPGLSIYSSFPNDTYAWWSGTSMATPFVAGTAALILSQAYGLKSADVAARMVDSAENWNTLNLLNSADALTK